MLLKGKIELLLTSSHGEMVNNYLIFYTCCELELERILGSALPIPSVLFPFKSS